MSKTINLPLLLTEEQKEQCRKVLDPTCFGRVNFDGFRNCVLGGIKKLKEDGKL